MSIAQITAAYATAIEALSAGATRMDSDLSKTAEEDIDALTAGQVKFQIRATFTGENTTTDSNVRLQTWSVEIAIHHRLSAPAAERTWTEGTMVTLQQQLARDEFWKTSTPAVFGIYDVTKVDFTEEPAREGHIVSFSVEGIIRTTS